MTTLALHTQRSLALVSAKVPDLSPAPRERVLRTVELSTSHYTLLAQRVSISGACCFPAEGLGLSYVQVEVSLPLKDWD